MTRRRVCVVTGSRAEYGLLQWVMHDLRAQPDIELQVIATASHLSHEFGMTVDQIERDGFEVTRRVEMLLSSDTAGGISKSMALGLIGLSDALEQLKPDVVLVLGDRYEILMAAQACLVHRIPLAHIAGGDVTEGAIDESIRHAITKMAHLHFVTNELSARRVRQLGEDPAAVHVVGSPGLDHIHRQKLLSRDELATSLGAPLGARNLLVTFHPVTLDAGAPEAQVRELLDALDALPDDLVFWVGKPNADAGGRAIAAELERWAATQPRARLHTSLGQLRYLSLMAQVDAVVGNSSSGLYEAPSFDVPTVDIGDRQRGRLAASSVLHCEPRADAIRDTIERALRTDCTGTVNPYGDGHSAGRIVAALRAMPPAADLLKKTFHLLEG